MGVKEGLGMTIIEKNLQKCRARMSLFSAYFYKVN